MSKKAQSIAATFAKARQDILEGVTRLTAYMVIAWRDAQSDEIKPLIAGTVLLKRGRSVHHKFVNYIVDPIDGEGVQEVIKPYRDHMVAALAVIVPTPNDTVETIEQQIAQHGGVESYLREYVERHRAEVVAAHHQGKA